MRINSIIGPQIPYPQKGYAPGSTLSQTPLLKPMAGDQIAFSGKTLISAVKSGELEAVESCLSAETDINQPLDASGNTALHLAAKFEQNEVFQFLLEHGAQMMQRNGNEEIPLMMAAERGHTNIVQMLLKDTLPTVVIQEQLYATNKNGLRADQIAEENGCEKLAALLEQKMKSVGPPSNPIAINKVASNDGALAPLQLIKQHYIQRKPFSQYTGPKEPYLTDENMEYLALRIQDDLADHNPKAEILTKIRLATQFHKGISEAEKSFWNQVSLTAFAQPLLQYLKPVKKGLGLVAGMEGVKQQLQSGFIVPYQYQTNPESFRRADGTMPYAKPSPLFGLILEGPPGTGKSYIAEKLAEELDRPSLTLKFSDIGSKMYSESEKAITQAFDKAAEHAPSFLIIDEIDSFLLAKDKAKDTDIKLINTMMTELEQARKKGVTVIGTTNHLDKLEEASIRDGRFDVIVHVSPPDQKARFALFNMFLAMHSTPDKKLPFTNQVRNEFAKRTRGFAAPKIETLCKELGTTAYQKQQDITPELMFKLIESKKPSYKKEVMDQYPDID